jgi:hypothetical protein
VAGRKREVRVGFEVAFGWVRHVAVFVWFSGAGQGALVVLHACR